MTAEQAAGDWREASPFRPFTIHLADGRTPGSAAPRLRLSIPQRPDHYHFTSTAPMRRSVWWISYLVTGVEASGAGRIPEQAPDRVHRDNQRPPVAFAVQLEWTPRILPAAAILALSLCSPRWSPIPPGVTDYHKSWSRLLFVAPFALAGRRPPPRSLRKRPCPPSRSTPKAWNCPCGRPKKSAASATPPASTWTTRAASGSASRSTTATPSTTNRRAGPKATASSSSKTPRERAKRINARSSTSRPKSWRRSASPSPRTPSAPATRSSSASRPTSSSSPTRTATARRTARRRSCSPASTASTTTTASTAS